MWFLLMFIILLTNGMSAFGLKVIVGWGLPGKVKFPYLSIWYAAGFASIFLPMIFTGVRVRRREFFWGAIVAALSIAGQIAMAVALDSHVPGHIVFPVAVGGSIIVVALVGHYFFNEPMNRFTATGVSLGLLAVVLLGISAK